MMDESRQRHITSLRLQLELGLEKGLALTDLLAGTGVTQAQLADNTAMVTAGQELQLVDNLVRLLPQASALGLQAGQRYHATAFGMLGFALMSCRNAKQALDVALKYFELTYAFTHITAKETAKQIVITLDDADLPRHLQRYIAVRDGTAMITVQRDLFAMPSMLEAVTWRFPKPDKITPYSDFFDSTLQFGSGSNQAFLNRNLAMAPLPQGNDMARQAAEMRCRELLNMHHRREGLAARVRDLIASSLPAAPEMPQVAAQLHLTPRTLRRHLKAENAGFTQLRDEVRQTLMKEYLAAGLSVEAVAERLGYAEATSFINACKRWVGCTPFQLRGRGEY